MEIKITVSDNLIKAIERFADALVVFTTLNNRGEDISFPEIKVEARKQQEGKVEAPTEPTEKKKDEVVISEEDIRAKFVTLNKKGKKAELKEVLTALGVEKVSSLKPEQFAEAMTKLEAIA